MTETVDCLRKNEQFMVSIPHWDLTIASRQVEDS